MKAAAVVKYLLQKKEISQSTVSKDIGGTSQNLSKKLNGADLDTQLIENISRAIKHNIFYDLALELEKEAGLKIPRKNEKQSPIDDAIVELLKERFPNVFK